MCGIAGLVDFEDRLGPQRIEAIAHRMAQRLAHRGPDGEGTWLSSDGRCAFSHRRLAIVDPGEGGRQPMTSAGESGKAALVFNGELYNFQTLRHELEARGAHFCGRSDSEVLLRGLDAHGPAFLERTEAMYALAYWTGEVLLLARDRFGEKPLYYLRRDGLIAFASELHALYELPDFDDRISVDRIALYCALHHIPAPYSIYDSIGKLMPGERLIAKPGRDAPRITRQTARRFLHPPRSTLGSHADIRERADALEIELVEAVRSRMTGDMPLGIFLSAGVDSALVATLMAKHLGYRPRAYSIGFAGYPNSEHHHAERLARVLGLTHETRMLRPEHVRVGVDLARHLDEPNGDSSCLLTALLSETVAKRGKVILSGDGGDELFGGYRRYAETVARAAHLPPGNAYLNGFLVFPPAALERIFGEIPPVCRGKLEAMRNGINASEGLLIERLRRSDADEYLSGAVLSKVDRMSMRSGVEVRSPFLASGVTNFAESLTEAECLSRGGKGLLKTVAERHLPPGWCDRPKQGFGLPMDTWARTFLEMQCRRLLAVPNSRLSAWIEPTRLSALFGSDAAPLHDAQLWTLFMLESWLRTHPARPDRERL